ncbi:Lysophospholipase, alpha-beta hydrolase superfamily [Singulisphaera sp. GP187]|uniref:alpha/beta hydrolase n=1 Tax=Singulisphaera sp. GP187 TaxID=1882752 RepID=UPI00092990B2|nr:alpha/beta fold hydrolase [Singulisphaera sp. GP187]SIO29061.1 Lysophospholipase, alpha-beta hydrolase superfamily [Singulisphaera sp. GP187]
MEWALFLERGALAMTVLGSGWMTGLVTVGGFVAGLLTWFVMLVSEWGAWALIMPGRRLSAAGPGDDFETGAAGGGVPIEATASDGTRLAGVWFPAGASPTPTGRTILLVHGFAEVRDAMKGRAELLAARGWNVARLDMRGYGRSGGGFASFGGREGDDLRAWVDVVAGRVGPAMSLAVWGRSMGAAIALRAAADEPRIVALLLESPYARLETVVAGWLQRIRTPLPSLLAPRIVRRASRLAGVSLSRPRPIELAPRITAPTLIVHGRRDTLVPDGDAHRLASVFPQPATLIEIQGAGHGNVIEMGGPDLLDRIVAFLDQATSR